MTRQGDRADSTRTGLSIALDQIDNVLGPLERATGGKPAEGFDEGYDAALREMRDSIQACIDALA